MRLLVDRGADIEAKAFYFGTPLVAATEYDHEEVAIFLAEQGANPHANAGPRYPNTAMTLASFGRQKEVVRAMVLAGADVDADGKFAFAVVHWNDLEFYEWLIDQGMEWDIVREHDDHPVHHAHVSMEMLDWFLARGADPAAKTDHGTDAPYSALRSERNMAMLDRLVAFGCALPLSDPITGESLLQVIMPTRAEYVEFIVRHGAEVNVFDEPGRPILFKALPKRNGKENSGRLRVLKILLDAGANPLYRDMFGRDAFPIAAAVGGVTPRGVIAKKPRMPIAGHRRRAGLPTADRTLVWFRPRESSCLLPVRGSDSGPARCAGSITRPSSGSRRCRACRCRGRPRFG